MVQLCKDILPVIVDIGCYYHTIDLVGEKSSVLGDFDSLRISLFMHSPCVQIEWRTRTGRSMKTFSSTRWWSKGEVFHDIFALFEDDVPFVQETEVSPITCNKLLPLLSDKSISEYLQMELAVVINAGKLLLRLHTS